MPTPMLRPLGIGETLDVAIKIYMRNAGTLFRLVLLVVAPVQLVSALVSASVTPSGDFYDVETGEFRNDDIWTFVAGTAVVTILTLIAATLALGLCFKAIVDAYLGGTADWRVALSFVTRRLHSIIWVTLFGGLIAVIGLLFCIVPGVYLYISFVVAVPVLLTERLKGRRALSRSRALVKGRWWSVFAVVLIGGILTSIVSGALSALDGIVAVTSDDPSSIGAIVVAFLTGTVASMVTTPLTAAIATVIYIDLRVRHEAFDLQLLAGQLGVDPPEGQALYDAPLLLDTGAPPAGSQPPFWPPPPGWTPGPPVADEGVSEAPTGSQPPFWPPPPGWTPGPPAADEGASDPPTEPGSSEPHPESRE